MNNASLSERERTAFDLANATILLLEIKSKHYNEYKAKSWNWNEVLTPHGKKLSEDAFNSLSAKSVLAGEKLVATYSIST